MLSTKKTFTNTDEYIAMFPGNIRAILEKLRVAIKASAPGAEEVISYKMPAFRLEGMLVWFAVNKEHIGFYPTASPIKVFRKELTAYKTSKGAIQFPIDKPIPLTLVKNIVKFRVRENAERAMTKKQKSSTAKK
jgi:uncharacterized protein YdhG (YjbR/CyaY superfamily)